MTSLVLALLACASLAFADVVTDANARAAEIASRQRPTPPAVRTMAIVQVSVFEAVRAITGRAPSFVANVTAKPGASVDAAVAAATHTALLELLPAEKPAIEADYQAALKPLADDQAKLDGVTVGEQAARGVLAARADDRATAPNTYLPRTSPSVYVPTTLPVTPHWGLRKPWAMRSGDQFRPAPPPALESAAWKRDLAEVRAVGASKSTTRTAEQTAIAKFWEATAPSIYWPVARAYLSARTPDVTESARLLAAAAIAMDDALIAVFDAKYAFNFWRPITATRNAPAGMREAGWEPFIDTPMHPEYPCAHCVISGALGAVLESDLAGAASPRLRSTSPTAPGVEREWATPAEFMKEVAEARIYDGVHYRNSAEVGTAQGKKVAELVMGKFPRAKR
ncbi:MAG: vanadium-dependent haloperoxidase [Candidatus Eisenbacteria bacterium]|uniref:Vanadium-dependent haloperoxidase n=1 Tax=Eiseniibacteriota bacterium TaxID=2212470 RepID=A0A849SU23_UNCEI|nr:vanadium-dependent haloperoxidase [Candidatus Eisenbacteria bacterium]